MKSLKTFFVGLFLMFGMVWLHTFIQINRYGNTDILGPLITVLVTMGYTLLGYWFITDDESLLAGPAIKKTGTCAILTGVMAIFMIFALILEMCCYDFSLYFEKEICLWSIEIPKKYLFDIWVVVLFPLQMQSIFRAMKRENFNPEALCCGIISISGMTLFGSAVFHVMSNIYLVELAVMNTLVLAVAIHKYALSEPDIKKGKAVGAVILYALIRIGLLALQGGWKGSLSRFMYGESWPEYCENVYELMRTASFFGTSDALLSSPDIHSWLSGRNNFIHQLLYYGGWLSVIILMTALVVFMVVMFRMLGMHNKSSHRNHLVFSAAFLMLADRIVMGILYSFGVPYPIALPFAGESGLITDTIGFTLLLIGAFENWKIDKFNKLEFVAAKEILGDRESYKVTAEDGEAYEGELTYDEADIMGTDNSVRCTTECYEIQNREFCAFKPKRMNKVIILEFAEQKWSPLKEEDADIAEQIEAMYRKNNILKCMEE